MADKIKVSTTRLGNDADKINESIRKIQNSMKTLKTHATQLDAMWDGPSSEAFKTAFHGDMAALNTVINNLAKIYHFEATAKSKYEKCEKKVGDIVSSIRV